MEKAPHITEKMLFDALKHAPSAALAPMIEKVNTAYEYWDSVKYKKVPEPYSPLDLWVYTQAERMKHNINAWEKYGIHFSLTNQMQQMCHEMDMNFGGSWENGSIIPDDRERYLVSSLMEEAISSSQMEGASTTRKVAKEMLRKKITPRDKSQQMIHNNYQTIQFIVEHRHEPLTDALLLKIHRLMTENTLEHEEDAGRLRTNNEVVVENGITHEVVHTPPSFDEIPDFIDALCRFFNAGAGFEDGRPFIHPIIKGIIIHFMVAYMHPFVDGNGRTSRALFYWYMLKQGYGLTQYLSISRIIYSRKKGYEKAFIYTETDHNDIGYFITYNLHVLEAAFKDLQTYIQRKCEEKKTAAGFLQLGHLNARQAEIIRLFYEDGRTVLTVKDLQVRFGISPTTAKTDLTGLMDKGIIKEIAFNKVKKGYIRGDNFDQEINI